MFASQIGAQPRPQVRVAWVSIERASAESPYLDAFRGGMRELGSKEGENLIIDRWWGDGSEARLEQQIDAIVRSRPTVIADNLGLQMRYYPVHSEAQLETALSDIARACYDAILAFADGFTQSFAGRIAAFSAQQRIPAVDGWSPFAREGNLMTYGPVLEDCYRRLAIYVDKISRGARPGDLPIELPTKVELVINLKTANALGMTIPQSLLLRADEVIASGSRTRSPRDPWKTQPMPLTFVKAFGRSASDDVWRSPIGVKAAGLTRATRLPILSPVQSPQAFVSIEKAAKRMFPSPGKSWFRTREGHRYGGEIALIIGIKFALLVALWFAFVAPWMHPANPPVNVVQQFYVPGEPAVTHD